MKVARGSRDVLLKVGPTLSLTPILRYTAVPLFLLRNKLTVLSTSRQNSANNKARDSADITQCPYDYNGGK